MWVRTDYVASHGIYLVELVVKVRRRMSSSTGRKAEVATLGARPGATVIPRSFDVVRAIQSCAFFWHLARHDVPSQLNPINDQKRQNA